MNPPIQVRDARSNRGPRRIESCEILVRAIVKDDEIEIQEVLDRFLRGQEHRGEVTKVHGIRTLSIDDDHGWVGTGVELHVASLDDWPGNASAALMEALGAMGKEVIATAQLPPGPAPVGPAETEGASAPWPPPRLPSRK